MQTIRVFWAATSCLSGCLHFKSPVLARATSHSDTTDHHPLSEPPADLWHGGLEEEVGHGSRGEVGGSEGDGSHCGVTGTALKVELYLETCLLKGSDGGNT